MGLSDRTGSAMHTCMSHESAFQTHGAHGLERVLLIGTQFSILYTSMYSPAEAATPRA